MYQALYRKWRPKTFDDVVGQNHITETLKQQVAGQRLSHAYLFTGTRGTGKTTCAKILSRAVNCLSPMKGNPCNHCEACLGIENGSILDVLELDAASNNGVDQVRELREEAIYSPAAVRKRVYIIDEVHMLTNHAFNALLKILEEPPNHLMFILATTELNKVPATIKSRCQQFAFKRILPSQISQRLQYVAKQEQLQLTPEGATLLARLADGGMRDALSLLDQCSRDAIIDEKSILDTLGLAGNLETARMLQLIARHDTSGALEKLARFYQNGKDISTILEELSCLVRDLLVLKTAPKGGETLLTCGYDEQTMRRLCDELPAPRLLFFLKNLQETIPQLIKSRNKRIDAELCVIRLCDESLDDSNTGLLARISNLEQRLADGAVVSSSAPVQPSGKVESDHKKSEDSPRVEQPEGLPPQPKEETETVQSEPQGAQPNETQYQDTSLFWTDFVTAIKGNMPPMVIPILTNPDKMIGTWNPPYLNLWVKDAFNKSVFTKPVVMDQLSKQAKLYLKRDDVQIVVQQGKPPQMESNSAVVLGDELSGAQKQAMEQLLEFGAQFDNIEIQ